MTSPAQAASAAPSDAQAARAERMAGHYARIRAAFTKSELAALCRLYELPKRHVGTSGGNAAAKLLLGLYNGTRFPFDLTELRCFDRANFEDAMTVIRMDAPLCRAEVHEVLNAAYADGFDTGAEFEHWACNLRLKGRCKTAYLPDEPRRQIRIEDFQQRTA